MEMWSQETIAKIKQKAATGKYTVQSMGSTRDLPHFDDLIILPAQNSRPPIDNYREPCETKTVIGSRFAENPLELDYPIMLGAMSFGALNESSKIAFAKGCTAMGISVNTGEGGMLPSKRKHAEKLIVQYASGRFGVSAKYLRSADAIELKIGQGAKPGMGGHLMGEKVTEKVSKIRGIPVGTDALSPARHMDIVGPEDLSFKISQLREITDWKVPIIVKYSPGRVKDDVKIAVKAGADAVAIDGMQAGTGAAPRVGIEHVGIPTIAALVEANNALEETGLRDEVSLIISGGIRHGADIAKALALGADAVQIATSAMISIGCVMCRQCHLGRCPAGITSNDPEFEKKLAPDAEQRFINYTTAITRELKMLTQLTGLTDVHNLDIDDLRSLSLLTSAVTGVRLVGT
ncbi:MAG: FMN-binding glutamate synthase family protein [Candidatus Altiarchaeota archaeon]|nr:FMN-binding glutamate synthase family protein [Candidatus Altiarchaeota archaeon]